MSCVKPPISGFTVWCCSHGTASVPTTCSQSSRAAKASRDSTKRNPARNDADRESVGPGDSRRFDMGSLSIWHWLIVLLVVVLIFGTKKLRNMGSDLGGAVKGFKDGMKDGASTDAPTATGPNAQVTGNATADKSTIDVEARQKS